MTNKEMLRGVALFAGLSDLELEALVGCLGQRTFGRGVIIFHKDNPGDTMYIIKTGAVRIFVLSESGQEISVNVYGPGDVFGELAIFDGLPRSAGAVALEDTVTFTLHRQDFLRQLESHPTMARGIIEVLSARVRYTTNYAEGLAFLDVCGRVAAKLLELGERYGSHDQGIEIDLVLTQGELATWVGTSRESVNKVLRRLQAQGLIRLDGPRIAIMDPAGLRRMIIY